MLFIQDSHFKFELKFNFTIQPPLTALFEFAGWVCPLQRGVCGAGFSPLALDQESGDEVFRLLRDVGELLLLEVPLAGQDVVERLVVILAEEGRQATESEGGGSGTHLVYLTGFCG